MGRRLSLLAILAASLAVPASASALEIGSDHSGGGALQWSCFDPGAPCVLIQDTIRGNVNNNVAPSAGRITGFKVRRAIGSFEFHVFRANGTPLANTGPITGTGADSVTGYTLNPPISVQAGDFIAILLGTGASLGVRDASGDIPATTLREFDTNLVEKDNGTVEAYLSATFQPNGVPFVPQVNDTVKALPDPLASLRSGKRPKARIAGGTLAVSKRRVAVVQITNPNGFTLKGVASLVAGKLKLGKAKVSLGPNATKTFKFKLSSKAMKRLRKRRKLRATLTAKLKGPIGKAGVTRKKLTLKAPAKPKRKRKRAPGGGKTPAGGDVWVARNGTTGAYDDFKFRLNGGNITMTAPSLLFVSCFEIGGSYRSSFSYELFNLLGPWKLGNQSETQKQQSIAVNQLVGSGQRTITYTVTSSRSGNKITGKRRMSFSGSTYNPFDNTIAFVNCSGTQNYEAIPG